MAYEPVWAIGTGEVATPDDAQEVCAALRLELGALYSPELADGVRVLYGGSVKAANAAELLAAARRRRRAGGRRQPGPGASSPRSASPRANLPAAATPRPQVADPTRRTRP